MYFYNYAGEIITYDLLTAVSCCFSFLGSIFKMLTGMHVWVFFHIRGFTMRLPVLLSLLLSLVDCQTAFRGVNLPNYGYVNLNEVGNAEDCSVQCRTDLTTCCSGAQIMQGVGHCGDWFLPSI